MKFLLLPLALLLDSCAAVPPPILSANGLGEISFGMPLAKAQRNAGSRRNPEKPLVPECDYVEFTALPGARFMVENGFVTRAEVEPYVANTLGIKIGDKLLAIQRAHPDARVSPHKYVLSGHYISFEGEDPNTAIVMEEVNSVVTRIRAGLKPSVEYVEGCL